MTRAHLPRFLSALVCLSASTALAQQYTISKIVFRGSVPYTQASLEAASGLKIGDTITKSDLQAAAQRLVDTGAFSTMQSSLEGQYKAVSVIFVVKPGDPARLLTASFENFVWYQPDELAAELQRRVPLFNGTVPEAGNLQDAVTAALQQMLSDKGIAAKVSEEPLAPSSSQPLRLAEYRVDTPSVRIKAMNITGATGTFAAAIARTVATLTGRPYHEGLAPTSLTNFLLASYRDAGYQAAALTGLTRTVAASTASRVDVDVSATVVPGDLYHVSTLDWPGSPIMSAQSFTSASTLHPGDIASRKSLLESLHVLESAYRNRGYIDVAVTAEPKLDAAAHTVAFTVAAEPGAQYTLKSVTPVNLTESQRKDFDRYWTLHPGDVYNEGYVASFLKNNTALHSLDNISASFKTVADPDAHTVDLTITFIK